jgi:dihydroneopterin aldolase
MDIVFISQLAVDMVIGVYDFEKVKQQRLLIDIEMARDIRGAAAADDLNQTVDYAVVSQRVTELLQQQPIELIETVAERIADLLLSEFAVQAVRVQVDKPAAVPAARTVGVRISRGRW